MYASKGQDRPEMNALAGDRLRRMGWICRKRWRRDVELKKYLVDPQVVLLIQNAKALAAGKTDDGRRLPVGLVCCRHLFDSPYR